MVLDRSVQQLAAISTGMCGEAALWGALITAGVMVLAGYAYLFTKSREVLWFVRAEMLLLGGLLTAAAGVLLAGLLGNDFSLAYVAANSERSLGVGYKIAAFWAGQEGSLLLWAWALGVMGVVMTWQMRRAEGGVVVITLSVMAMVSGFLVALMLGLRDPFLRAKELMPDGAGLRPALQNLAMVFHPPLLFLGYAGFAAPWAFMLGGLLAGRRQFPQADAASRHWTDQWVLLARPWMVLSWVLLGVGIILGAAWAYVALGWGGYWAWDAVENASLLPWLTGTALLHSALLQVRQGVFRRWTAILAAASFFLCILGTYITRSGIINSVHAPLRRSVPISSGLWWPSWGLARGRSSGVCRHCAASARWRRCSVAKDSS
jgi:cytochrome c-type biogenesis protein CcmF